MFKKLNTVTIEQTLFCNITVTPVTAYLISTVPLTSELQKCFTKMLTAGGISL